MIKFSYDEGTWFLVPLRKGDGFARGIVVRANEDSGILFGYFFGPIVNSPDEDMPQNLIFSEAILCGRFGHLGLAKGDWPVLGICSSFSRDDWPLPKMVRVDERANIAFKSTYNSETLEWEYEEVCDPSEAVKFPYDRLMGAGSVEIRLTKLLGN